MKPRTGMVQRLVFIKFIQSLSVSQSGPTSRGFQPKKICSSSPELVLDPSYCTLTMDYTSLVLSQCRSISWKVSEARVMKDRCRQLGLRLSSVEEMVRALQNGFASPQVGGALQRLYTTLMSADELVQKCTVNRIVNKSKYKSEFNILEQRIQDSLRVLATVPHVSQAPSTNHAPPASQAVQRYIVEEEDDDSDDDLGILVPFALGGAMTPAATQPNLQYQAVVLTDGSNVFVAERLTGRF